MIIKSIKYSQFANKPQAWHLDEVTLGPINLIVGKNATGKTRTLNIIGNLANLVSGDKKLFPSGDFNVVFNNGNNIIKYNLGYENSKVFKEELIINNEPFLKREVGGKGEIQAVELKRMIKFHVPDTELACVARRDSVQHPFFEDLYQWGKSSIVYYFGTQLGKDSVVVFLKDKKDEVLNLKETNLVVNFFKKGFDKYHQSFIESIKKEMELIGYKIDTIETGPVAGIIGPDGTTVQAQGLLVKESELKGITSQMEISQGMFRALSLIIQLDFLIREKHPSCVLIDDIGEGLDYERSTALIKILIEKAKGSNIQLIMSTNDRFVMNAVPLEYWSVIQRVGGTSKIFNYSNSKRVFDEFKFSGLNNFDFLSTDFYLNGFGTK
jgi:energy-coupling factor transporter ATP-binding protein EcfA2